MDNLIFSLNATMPLFLMMLTGYIFRRTGLMSKEFASGMNSFVFKAALPAMLFKDLATVDFASSWDTRFVLFCFAVTLLSIGAAYLLSLCFGKNSNKGEFIQASYRSSAAILGLAFIQNIYGTSGMAPLMIIGSVPLYNIVAVIVLTVFSPDKTGMNGRELVKESITGVLTNPIILGIAAGFAWSLLKLPMPVILSKTVSLLGGTSSPLGLLAMGASFEPKAIEGKLGPAALAACVKLLGFCAIFLPLAVRLGFRNEMLIAILVMLGSSTTVSSYVMAKNMGHEGSLTACAVMLTTMLSAFTLTFWLYLLRSFGLV